MSDTALNKIIQYGTRANRIAFTPSPASGSQVLYLWYETDHAPDVWAWDGSAWQQINTGGSGTVTTTGSPASGNLAKFSGATSITNGDLSGDVTTSSTLATTIAANAVTTSKINDAAVTLAKIANASANSVLVGSGAAGSGSAYAEIALGTGLSMSGTTLSSTGGSAGFVLLEQHTASSSATLDFTTAFTSSYSQYVLMLDGIVPASNAVDLYLLISTDGGATFLTASNYYWAHETALSSSIQGPAGGQAVAKAQITDAGRMLTTAGTSLNATIYLNNMLSGTNFFSFHGFQQSWNSGTDLATVSVAGAYKVANTPNAIRLQCSSGNISAGTGRIYGLAK